MHKIGALISLIGYFSRLAILIILGYAARESLNSFGRFEVLEGIAYLLYACVGGPIVYVIGNIIIGIGVSISEKGVGDELD